MKQLLILAALAASIAPGPASAAEFYLIPLAGPFCSSNLLPQLFPCPANPQAPYMLQAKAERPNTVAFQYVLMWEAEGETRTLKGVFERSDNPDGWSFFVFKDIPNLKHPSLHVIELEPGR